MERPQLTGTDVERCRECGGRVVQADEEFVCTSCGVVTRNEKPIVEVPCIRQVTGSRRLGSYMGRKDEKCSTADFGNWTVGHAKRLSDSICLGDAEGNCSVLTRRVADKLALPPSIRENAAALSAMVLAHATESRVVTRRRTSVPAISAYALLSACRSAGMDHIGTKTVLRTYADLGHDVTKSSLLWLGTQEAVPLRPADPAALLRTAVVALESNLAVARKLGKSGVEPRPYFRSVLRASNTIVEAIRATGEGRSPRTLAAASVYLASLEVGPRVITQKDVAEALGVAEYTVREYVATVNKEFCLGPLRRAGP